MKGNDTPITVLANFLFDLKAEPNYAFPPLTLADQLLRLYKHGGCKEVLDRLNWKYIVLDNLDKLRILKKVEELCEP